MTEWLSIEQAAKEADLSSKTFRRLMEDRNVTVQQLGRRKRISRENLRRFMDSLNQPYRQPGNSSQPKLQGEDDE